MRLSPSAFEDNENFNNSPIGFCCVVKNQKQFIFKSSVDSFPHLTSPHQSPSATASPLEKPSLDRRSREESTHLFTNATVNDRLPCVKGDSPRCGEMSAKQTKGAARTRPAAGGEGLLFFCKLKDNPSVTATPCHLPLHKGGFHQSTSEEKFHQRGVSRS